MICYFASFTTPSLADEFFLQLEEATDATQPEVVRSLEANATLGRPFYIKTVTGGRQWLLRGTIEKRPSGEFAAEFVFQAADLGENPAPRTELADRRAVTLWRKMEIGRPGGKPGTHFTLTLYPFVPHIGYRDTTSGFSLRLVDEAGQPVANAKAGLYESRAETGTESGWNLIVGPGRSDADGVVRISEGRESLTELTFIAKHQDRALMATARLDRNNASPFHAKMPATVTMRKARIVTD